MDINMKGFGIYVKNDLLDPKHVKQMDAAIWLYLWLLDRMTSISEEGVGRVLGGKPLIYDDLKADLGVHKNTYSRWVGRLRQFKYIGTKRTPNGLIFFVFKAHKRFTTQSDSPRRVIHQKRGSESPNTGRETPSMVIADQTDQDNTIPTKARGRKRLLDSMRKQLAASKVIHS